MDLLDLLQEQEHAVDPRREWVHSTMPNMGYACGGNIVDGLPDGGPRGRNVLGGWGKCWAEVTCPDCRSEGRAALAMRAHRQQMESGHVCPETPGPNDPWQCARTRECIETKEWN